MLTDFILACALPRPQSLRALVRKNVTYRSLGVPQAPATAKNVLGRFEDGHIGLSRRLEIDGQRSTPPTHPALPEISDHPLTIGGLPG